MNTTILPFWKDIGTSSSIIAKRVSEKLNLPTSHTGTLDPLASGVVVVIVGEDSKNKEKFISNEKTYEFEFLFGISTDTHDALGIIEDISPQNFTIDIDKIEETLKSFVGNISQKYPNFSSKKVLGRTLWEYKRLNLPVPEVFINGEIKEVKIKGYQKIKSSEVLDHIKNQINLIQGNFRQREILEKYNSSNFPEFFYTLKVEVVMTRGLYVRALARDLGNRIGLPTIILDLVRLKDGDIEKKDCQNTNEYFKNEIEANKNFLYPDFRNL